MTYPLGYYCGARSEHPAAPILAELQEKLGGYFELLSVPDLRSLLAFCSVTCIQSEPIFNLTQNLEANEATEWALDQLAALRQVDGGGSFQLGIAMFLVNAINDRWSEVAE